MDGDTASLPGVVRVPMAMSVHLYGFMDDNSQNAGYELSAAKTTEPGGRDMFLSPVWAHHQ